MIAIEVSNRSGVEIDEQAAVALARDVLAAESVEDGELGLAFVAPDEIRELKREHLGIDEATDVLSFPLDGKDPVPADVPRALGDVDGIAFVRFGHQDVVRHKLVQRIVEAYRQHAEVTGTQRRR